MSSSGFNCFPLDRNLIVESVSDSPLCRWQFPVKKTNRLTPATYPCEVGWPRFPTPSNRTNHWLRYGCFTLFHHTPPRGGWCHRKKRHIPHRSCDLNPRPLPMWGLTIMWMPTQGMSNTSDGTQCNQLCNVDRRTSISLDFAIDINVGEYFHHACVVDATGQQILVMRQLSTIHTGNSKTNIQNACVIAHVGLHLPDALHGIG